MPIERVGVIGAGTMGNGIAHVFARSGYRVTLCDVEQKFLDRGLETIAMSDVQTIVSDFVLLFAVIDPIGTVPIFIAATRGQTEGVLSVQASVLAHRRLRARHRVVVGGDAPCPAARPALCAHGCGRSLPDGVP